MANQLPRLVQLLPKWLVEQWFSSATPETQEHWDVVPPGIIQALDNQLTALPPPPPYQKSIQLAAREALKAWQTSPETASNCLVVLGSPVDAIPDIIKNSLQDYLLDCDVNFVLSDYQRSPQALAITDHLRQQLTPIASQQPAEPPVSMSSSDLQNYRPSVLVIPSLEPCFLRCIQGWEGIEYLQNQIAQNSAHFWVLGCNHWAWVFLDKVCQVSAYLEQTLPLPKLTGEALSQWLHPLLNNKIECEDESLTVRVTADDDLYWEALAKLSNGSATAAAQLWLQSLRVDADQLTAEGTLPPDTQTLDIVMAKPALPSLAKLETLDRYLLHTLLIHGQLTRPHLALSLGENERIIRSRVQVLEREGIIRQTAQQLTVHPACYPKLYSELSNNNFLIGQA
ncbi:MAG: hypothetical protein AAF892_18240 [Cyanobacteria bacterium P01_D01_bin.71]